MKITTPEQLQTENVAGDIESIEAGIDQSSMPFVFEMLSKSLYSNPIGSIVREITSNCFDSHIEAGVDDAVVIRRGIDDEGTYISFNDYGVGLSPERIKKVYMNYFSSTKRETNDQIGGFGLGSKTPLSYSDYFYINTVSNIRSIRYSDTLVPYKPLFTTRYYKGFPIKYMYVFSKGETKPTLDLLGEYETTDRNGTEIKIPIKDKDDVDAFRDELRKQLCYFDNVYFENWNISNDYKIYEGEKFKYKTIDHYDEHMHIVLGKVSYPIDWKAIDKREVNIAVGVKFEIGELQVTPNREAIRYTDEAKYLIRTRIAEAVDELVSIFEKQNTMFDSYYEWYKKRKEKPYINFAREGDETPFEVHKLYLHGIDYIEKKHQYKYFEGIEGIRDVEDLLDALFDHIGSIDKGKQLKETQYIGGNTTEYILGLSDRNARPLIASKPYINNGRNWFIKHGEVFFPRLNKEFFNYVRPNVFYTYYKDSDGRTKHHFNLGSGIKLYKCLKAIYEEIKANTREYLPLNAEEQRQYDAYKRENDGALQRKLAGKVHIKSISQNQKYEEKVEDIYNYTGLIIYGFQQDTKALERAISFLALAKPEYFKWSSNRTDESGNITRQYYKLDPKICRVIQISKAVHKHFKYKKNMTHVANLYSDNKLFRKLASAFKIEAYFDDIDRKRTTLQYIETMKEINAEVGQVLEDMYVYWNEINYMQENNIGILYARGSQSEIQHEVMNVAKQYNLYDPVVEAMFAKIDKWFEGVEIIRYTELNEKNLPHVLKLLYDKKKRLNTEYYQRVMDTGKMVQLAFNFEPEENTFTKFEIVTQNVA